MIPSEVLAAAALLIAILGTIASAGGSIVGFIRGCRKFLLSIVMEPVSKLTERYNDYEKTSSRQIEDLQQEQVLIKGDLRIAREEGQEQRQETADLRRQIQRHAENEEMHVK